MYRQALLLALGLVAASDFAFADDIVSISHTPPRGPALSNQVEQREEVFRASLPAWFTLAMANDWIIQRTKKDVGRFETPRRIGQSPTYKVEKATRYQRDGGKVYRVTKVSVFELREQYETATIEGTFKITKRIAFDKMRQDAMKATAKQTVDNIVKVLKGNASLWNNLQQELPWVGNLAKAKGTADPLVRQKQIVDALNRFLREWEAVNKQQGKIYTVTGKFDQAIHTGQRWRLIDQHSDRELVAATGEDATDSKEFVALTDTMLKTLGYTVRHVTVDAKGHSSAGGTPLDTAIDVKQGQTILISVDPKQTWSAGPSDWRTSNADGITAVGPYAASGLTANYGSLVAQFGNSPRIQAGVYHRAIVPSAGRVKLCYWDQNAHDNTGSIKVRIAVK